MKSKLEQLLRKQEELKAQIRQEKNKLDQAERKKDTRRKILLGALMMDMMKKGELDEKNIMKKLDSFLTRDTDRKLFDLDSIKELPQSTSTLKKSEKSSTVKVIIEKFSEEKRFNLIRAIGVVRPKLPIGEVTKLLSSLPTSVVEVDSKKAEQIKKNLTEAGAKVTLKK